ncbi:hypothetical protein C8J57DRAFT_1251842 [Mycena rebaudengoi]|nr:hypothetical protein C8J57DRAFT_1251842 [Mycena rebaudengoi]
MQQTQGRRARARARLTCTPLTSAVVRLGVRAQRAPARFSASGTMCSTPRPVLPRPHRSYTTPRATWEPSSVCSSTRRFATRGGDVPAPSRGSGVRNAASQPAPAQLYTRTRAVCRARAGLTPRLEPPHRRRPSAAYVCRSSARRPPRHAGRARRSLATCACVTRRSLRVRAELGGAKALPSQSAAGVSGAPCSSYESVRVAVGALARDARTSRNGRGLARVAWLETCAHGSRSTARPASRNRRAKEK